jgi:hypothetical protein
MWLFFSIFLLLGLNVKNIQSLNPLVVDATSYTKIAKLSKINTPIQLYQKNNGIFDQISNGIQKGLIGALGNFLGIDSFVIETIGINERLAEIMIIKAIDDMNQRVYLKKLELKENSNVDFDFDNRDDNNAEKYKTISDKVQLLLENIFELTYMSLHADMNKHPAKNNDPSNSDSVKDSKLNDLNVFFESNMDSHEGGDLDAISIIVDFMKPVVKVFETTIKEIINAKEEKGEYKKKFYNLKSNLEKILKGVNDIKINK